MKKLLIVVIFSAVTLGLFQISWAETSCEGLGGEPLYSCLGRQIGDLQKALEQSKAATAPLEAQINKLDAQIKSIQAQIKAAEKKEQELEISIEKREESLTEQYVLLAKKLREYYKRMRTNSMLLWVMSKAGGGEKARELQYRAEAAAQDRLLILSLSDEIGKLEQDKKSLEANRTKLAALQVSLDKQADFFRAEVAGAKAYQSSLEGKIASLSSLQQSVLSEKQETFQTTVGDVPLADDPNSRPDYNPGFSPAFAAFSFGAPHFKGMSQYGAYGRAKAGQGVEDILRAYYGGGIEIKKDYSTSINITVSGYGTVDIETYVKRIYEMPTSWGDNGGFEALKAQAVAARSYALAYTNNGSGSICATESCQVYKPSNKGGKWDEAVNATRGWVLVTGGKPLQCLVRFHFWRLSGVIYSSRLFNSGILGRCGRKKWLDVTSI